MMERSSDDNTNDPAAAWGEDYDDHEQQKQRSSTPSLPVGSGHGRRRSSLLSLSMFDVGSNHTTSSDPFAPLSIDEGISIHKQSSGGESKEASLSSYHGRRRSLRLGGLRGENEMDMIASFHGESNTSQRAPSPQPPKTRDDGVSRFAASLQEEQEWRRSEATMMETQQPRHAYDDSFASSFVSSSSDNITTPSLRQQLRQDRLENSLYNSNSNAPRNLPPQQHHQQALQPLPYELEDDNNNYFSSSYRQQAPLHRRPQQQHAGGGSYEPLDADMGGSSSSLSALQSSIAMVTGSAAAGVRGRNLPLRSLSASSSYEHASDMPQPPALSSSSASLLMMQQQQQPPRHHHQDPYQQQDPQQLAMHSSFSSYEDDDGEEGGYGGAGAAGGEGDGADSRFKPFHEEKWAVRYKELVQFHRQNGHSAVPHTYPPNPQLARWVKRQRRQCKLLRETKPSTMTQERLDLLNMVDFIWDSHEVNWREKLLALDHFRMEHGHCNVPSNYTDKKLATWVKCQRRQYKLYWDGKGSAMCPRRINELESRGFEWEIRSSSSAVAAAASAAAASSSTGSKATGKPDKHPSLVSATEVASAKKEDDDTSMNDNEPLPLHTNNNTAASKTPDDNTS